MAREPRLRLLPSEEAVLRGWVDEASKFPRRARRARVVLELARGGSDREIAHRVGVHPETVARWGRRFRANRLEGLLRDAPRVRPRARVSPALVERIVRTTREEPPAKGVRWTTRSLARTLRVNHMLVHRVWQASGIPTSAEHARGAAEPGPASVEVVGVFFGSPTAIVFGLVTEDAATAGGADSARASPNVGRSGAYRGNDVRTTLGLLTTLDQALEAVVPVSVPPRQRSHELLVFLRGVEERGTARSEYHVFFDRADPEPEDRLTTWLTKHHRFRPHYPSAGESWTGAIDRWLREGPQRYVSVDRIRVSAPFKESIERLFSARFAGSDE